MPASVARDFAAQGLFGLQTPRALAGLELANVDVFRVVEQLA